MIHFGGLTYFSQTSNAAEAVQMEMRSVPLVTESNDRDGLSKSLIN
jgi:hypothetical protein